jgi:hypothetical protein
MEWKYIALLKTRIYPQRLPNASAVTWSLDHSYCKRETSLTKFKNSQSVMILVVRLGQLTEKRVDPPRIIQMLWRTLTE